MRGLVWLLLPAAALAADSREFEVSLRTEQQARFFASQFGGSPDVPFFLLPTATFRRHFPATTFALTYNPQLLLGAGRSARPVFSHQGRVGLTHRAGQNQYSLQEGLSYGTIDFFLLSALAGPNADGTPPLLQPLPALTPLAFINSATDGSANWVFDRRNRGGLRGSYLYSGGLDDEARTQLPLQRRGTVAAYFEHDASRTHTVWTQASASRAIFSNGPSAVLGVLLQGWRGRLSPVTDLSLAIGPSAISSTPSRGAPYTWLILPAVSATWRHSTNFRHHRLALDAQAQLAPFLDWITGIASQRLDLTAGLTWAGTQQWSGKARARGALNVATSQPIAPQSLASLELSATYAPRPTFQVEIGSRLLWQQTPFFGATPFWQVLTYVALTVSERGIL
ncbi:MAG: hypothetical protein ACKVPX_16245 [Myxococcaceae bacterium]